MFIGFGLIARRWARFCVRGAEGGMYSGWGPARVMEQRIWDAWGADVDGDLLFGVGWDGFGWVWLSRVADW